MSNVVVMVRRGLPYGSGFMVDNVGDFLKSIVSTIVRCTTCSELCGMYFIECVCTL